MLIQIQYFSQLRDLGGPESVELAEGTTVDVLLKRLFEMSPSLAHVQPSFLEVRVGT